MTLKQIIKIVSDAYTDGRVEQYFNRPSGKHGDGLAEFIAQELKETYDPKATTMVQLAEACRVMASAADQLRTVCLALGSAMAKRS